MHLGIKCMMQNCRYEFHCVVVGAVGAAVVVTVAAAVAVGFFIWEFGDIYKDGTRRQKCDPKYMSFLDEQCVSQAKQIWLLGTFPDDIHFWTYPLLGQLHACHGWDLCEQYCQSYVTEGPNEIKGKLINMTWINVAV